MFVRTAAIFPENLPVVWVDWIKETSGFSLEFAVRREYHKKLFKELVH